VSYTAPTTRSQSDLITASIYNTDLVDNITYLKSAVNAQIQIGAGAWLPRQTGGGSSSSFQTTTYTKNFKVLDFTDSGGVLIADCSFILPSDYDGGTVTFNVVWTCQNASTNSAVFGLSAVCWGDGDALDATNGTAVTIADANNGNEMMNKTAESSALTIGGTPSAGKKVLFSVYRSSGDASDTLAATVRLLDVTITYTRT